MVGSEAAPRVNLLPADGCAVLVAAAVAGAAADALFERLVRTIPWRQETARVFGRAVPVPRLTAWYGTFAYSYSGVEHLPRPWLDDLDGLRMLAEALAGMRVAGLLANLYRDGRDSVGWHADNEPALGPDPVVASFSFGAVRRFKLRHRADRSLVVDLDLPHGSCLIMGPGVQRHWLHAVPKTRRPVGPRLNLTFRGPAVAGPT